MPAARWNSSSARCGVDPLPGRAVADRPRRGLGQCDQLGDRVDRRLRIHRQHDRHLADQGHRREVTRHVERRRLVQGLVGGDRVGRQHQRMAVRRAVDQRAQRDVGAGTGFVLDHHGLAQAGRDLLADGARDDVHRTARCEADQQFHGPGREGGGLRERAAGRTEAGGGEDEAAAVDEAHEWLLPASCVAGSHCISPPIAVYRRFRATCAPGTRNSRSSSRWATVSGASTARRRPCRTPRRRSRPRKTRPSRRAACRRQTSARCPG